MSRAKDLEVNHRLDAQSPLQSSRALHVVIALVSLLSDYLIVLWQKMSVGVSAISYSDGYSYQALDNPYSLYL